MTDLAEISRKASRLFSGPYPFPPISRDRYVFHKALASLRQEIDGMKRDHSLMISEYLDAQDRRMKCSAWKEMADRTKARYERLEKLIG